MQVAVSIAEYRCPRVEYLAIMRGKDVYPGRLDLWMHKRLSYSIDLARIEYLFLADLNLYITPGVLRLAEKRRKLQYYSADAAQTTRSSLCKISL
jgi:hypothetical protein